VTPQEKAPTFAELMAAPPAALVTNEPKPLGVPRNYVAGDVPPTFFDGDEWAPATLSPGQVARLQDILAGIGLLTEYRRGYWDPNSQKAYREVLEYANGAGITDEMEAIRRIAETGALGGKIGGGRTRAPLTVRKSNPLDIKSAADAVAQNVLGRGLTNDELPQIIAAIQQMETSVQTQAYNMDETGGTVTEAPSLAAFVEQKLRIQNPGEAQDMDVSGQVNNLMDIFGMGN
jgi:hypothetical protein